MDCLHELVYRLSTEPDLRRRFLAQPRVVASALGLPPGDETAAVVEELARQLARQVDGSGAASTPAGPGWLGGPALTSTALGRGAKGSEPCGN